jgi:uncharacterized protein YraI
MKNLKALILAGLMMFVLVVPAFAVTLDDTQPNGGVGPVSTYHITGNNVNLRVGPGTSYASLGQVNRGDYCDKKGVSGDWVKVSMTSGQQIGRSGYVYKDYVAFGYAI